MPDKSLHIKKSLISALEKTLGVVTSACKNVGVSRQTFYDYYNSDEAFKNEVDELKNVALDFAESQLHKRMKDNSDAAIIFYLKTQGRKRGYVERQDFSHQFERGIFTEIDLDVPKDNGSV
jgi:hypothetical protein